MAQTRTVSPILKTLHCFIYHNCVYGATPPFAERGGLSYGPTYAFPQFLDILGGSGHGYQSWGQSESDINREPGLPSVHKKIGTETHGGLLGTVVNMD